VNLCLLPFQMTGIVVMKRSFSSFGLFGSISIYYFMTVLPYIAILGFIFHLPLLIPQNVVGWTILILLAALLEYQFAKAIIKSLGPKVLANLYKGYSP